MNSMYDIGSNNGYLLLRAAQQYRLEIAKVLQPQGITPTQFFILMSIWYQAQHTAPPTQVTVAEYAAVDINVTSQVIRKLLARGLIKRSVKPGDSRAYVLTLTAEGETLAKAAGRSAEEFHQTFFHSINQQNLQTELRQLIKTDK
jgi:DNA-binding MarR family transcriptional regulator